MPDVTNAQVANLEVVYTGPGNPGLLQVPPDVAADGVPAINFMFRVCGFSARERAILIYLEGLTTIGTLLEFTVDDLQRLFVKRTKLNLSRGGFDAMEIAQKRARALLHWLKHQEAQGLTADPNLWLPPLMGTSAQAMDAAKISKDTDSDITPPKKFTPDQWYTGKEVMLNYLSSQKSVDGITPLAYVIRKPLAAGTVPATANERLIHNKALTGPHFDRDNVTVYSIYKQWTLQTSGYTWIKQFDQSQNGRAAALAMFAHYDGPGEVKKRKATALDKLKKIHWNNSANFSFEKYTSTLKDLFYILNNSDDQTYREESKQVDFLIEHMNSNNQSVITHTALAHNLHPDSFDDCANYIAEKLVTIFPGQESKHGSRRTSAASTRGHRKKKGHLTKPPQGAPPGVGKMVDGRWEVNGYDCSDLYKQHPRNVFNSFPKELKAVISKGPPNQPNHPRNKNKRSRGGGGSNNRRGSKSGDRSVAAVSFMSELTESIARGVKAASRHNTQGEDNDDNESNGSVNEAGGSSFGRGRYESQPKKKKGKKG